MHHPYCCHVVPGHKCLHMWSVDGSGMGYAASHTLVNPLIFNPHSAFISRMATWGRPQEQYCTRVILLT